MATVTQIQRETASFRTKEPRNDWGFFFRDSAQLNDQVTPRASTVQRDTAELNDRTTQKKSVVWRETARFVSRSAGSVRITLTYRDSISLLSRALESIRVTRTQRDTAELNDRSSGKAPIVLRESAILNDRTTFVGKPTRTLRDTVAIISRLANPATLSIREQGVLNDRATFKSISTVSIRDNAQLNDATTRIVHAVVAYHESAVIRGAATPRLTIRPVVRDRGDLSDNPVAPASGRAYTCSVITWGMSVWLTFPFESMAGNFVSTNNLWRLNGLSDNGVPFESYIRTGVMDMGADRFKRMSALYATGYSDSNMTVTITGDVNGGRESYDYDMQLRDQEDYRNNRAIIGKGFRSRYIQMKIGATSVQYKLLDASADVAVTARRV